MGALISLDYTARLSTPLSGLIVVNPYLKFAQPKPLPLVILGHILSYFLPKVCFNADVDSAKLTHAPEKIKDRQEDPPHS